MPGEGRKHHGKEWDRETAYWNHSEGLYTLGRRHLAIEPIAYDGEDLMVVLLQQHQVAVSDDAVVAQSHHFRRAPCLLQELHIRDGRATAAEFAGQPANWNAAQIFPLMRGFGLELVRRDDGTRRIGRQRVIH